MARVSDETQRLLVVAPASDASAGAPSASSPPLLEPRDARSASRRSTALAVMRVAAVGACALAGVAGAAVGARALGAAAPALGGSLAEPARVSPPSGARPTSGPSRSTARAEERAGTTTTTTAASSRNEGASSKERRVVPGAARRVDGRFESSSARKNLAPRRRKIVAPDLGAAPLDLGVVDDDIAVVFGSLDEPSPRAATGKAAKNQDVSDSRASSSDAESDDSDAESDSSENQYDNDGSIPWDMISPPPTPPRPPAPPAPSGVGELGTRASDAWVRPLVWGEKPSPANDGAMLRRGASDASSEEARRRAAFKRAEADAMVVGDDGSGSAAASFTNFDDFVNAARFGADGGKRAFELERAARAASRTERDARLAVTFRNDAGDYGDKEQRSAGGEDLAGASEAELEHYEAALSGEVAPEEAERERRVRMRSTTRKWNDEEEEWDPARRSEERSRRDEWVRDVVHGGGRGGAEAHAAAALGGNREKESEEESEEAEYASAPGPSEEDAYADDGSVPWDWVSPEEAAARERDAERERERENRRHPGTPPPPGPDPAAPMLGLEPDEYEEELRSGRASMTPEERAEAAAIAREAERAAAPEGSLGAFDAEESVAWDAPPAPSAPDLEVVRRLKEARRRQREADKPVPWEEYARARREEKEDPGGTKRRLEAREEARARYLGRFARAGRSALDPGTAETEEALETNPDGSVPWDAPVRGRTLDGRYASERTRATRGGLSFFERFAGAGLSDGAALGGEGSFSSAFDASSGGVVVDSDALDREVETEAYEEVLEHYADPELQGEIPVKAWDWKPPEDDDGSSENAPPEHYDDEYDTFGIHSDELDDAEPFVEFALRDYGDGGGSSGRLGFREDTGEFDEEQYEADIAGDARRRARGRAARLEARKQKGSAVGTAGNENQARERGRLGEERTRAWEVTARGGVREKTTAAPEAEAAASASGRGEKKQHSHKRRSKTHRRRAALGEAASSATATAGSAAEEVAARNPNEVPPPTRDVVVGARATPSRGEYSAVCDRPVFGPDGVEPMCRHFRGDALKCQTFTPPAQSCWHKTVGSAFTPGGEASSAASLGTRGGASSALASVGPPTRKLDPAAVSAWQAKFYACMSGVGDEWFGAGDAKVYAPYRAPTARQLAGRGVGGGGVGGVEKRFRASRNSAYFWNFVHVPKAGGTYFKSLLHANEARRERALGGPDPRWDPELVKSWPTRPLVDMTEHSYANVMWRYANRDFPASQFSGDGMRASYDAGYRAVSKGALSFGSCEHIDAPCAYLTVLRDPMERFVSHYSYLCLEGSEGMTSWDPEWIAEEEKYRDLGCPASPSEFLGRVGKLTQLFAPGADPESACGVEAAKRNLVSPCVRYLFLDKLDDGLARMRARLPDFPEIGAETAKTAEGARAAGDAAQADLGARQHPGSRQFAESRHNDSGKRLTPAKKARLERYLADPKEMAKVREALRAEAEIYRFAEAHYEAQWEKDLQTC